MTVFSNDWFEATVDPAGGKATISRMEGGSSIPFLLNFTWGIVTATGKSITSASHPISSKVFTSAYIDEIGKGKLVELSTRVSPECIDLLLKLVFYDDTPAFTMELVVTNHGSLPVPILEISPAITSAKAGSGLFVSRDLSRCRILEAGLAGVFDLNVRCVAGDEESDSNGNVLVFDELTSKSILCGVIERPNAMVEILANESGAKGLIDELSGLKSFPDWAIKKSIVPFKQVRQNVSYTSNRVLFDTDGKKTPFEMLESYADRLAACLHVEKWPLDKPTPHGWNSWGNPSKTDRHDAGGKNLDALVHDITEDVVMENLAIADDRLGKFGLAYFQIDDGYQQAHGDWDFNAEKFPRGAKYLFDAIKERGYNPGLWIRPFDLALESKTLACHPEWGLDWEESFPMKERSRKPLDVSRPDVRRWLAEIFTRHARYHGVTWIKTDFTYLLLGGKGFHDPDMTAIEAMQEGFKIIRDAIGPGVFLVGIGGPCVFHYGLVHAERLTLDVQPAWGEDGAVMPTEQGIKPNARCIARRFYLNNRVWFTHADVLQFRAPLTRDQYLVQATVIGLTCGVFKVGEKFTNMAGEHFDVVSRLLPVYRPRGRGMRPLDLLDMEYPEAWDLLVDDAGNGLGEYHVVGLFNWDGNECRGQRIEGGSRTIQLDFAKAGLDPKEEHIVFDYWNEKLEGTFKGRYSKDIKPRSVQLVAVHKNKGIPQLVSSSRHVTQGAMDIKQVEWREHELELAIEATAVLQHHNRYHFNVPAGYSLKGVSCRYASDVRGTSPPVESKVDGHHVLVSVHPDRAADILIVLQFERVIP